MGERLFCSIGSNIGLSGVSSYMKWRGSEQNISNFLFFVITYMARSNLREEAYLGSCLTGKSLS